MADQKISQLPSGSPSRAADKFPIARQGANYSITTSDIATYVATVIPPTTPAGTTGQLQFNNSNAFGGASTTYDAVNGIYATTGQVTSGTTLWTMNVTGSGSTGVKIASADNLAAGIQIDGGAAYPILLTSLGNCIMRMQSKSGATVTNWDVQSYYNQFSIGTNVSSFFSIGLTGSCTITAQTGSYGLTVSNSAGGIHSTQISDATGALQLAGYLGQPQNPQTSAYSVTLAERGKHVSITTGGVTVTASPSTYNGSASTGQWTAGDQFSVYNNSGSPQVVSQGTSVTLRLGGSATTVLLHSMDWRRVCVSRVGQARLSL